MRRFFVPREAIRGNTAIIEGELFRHLAKVLRLKSGDRIIVADGIGMEYEAEITSLGHTAIVASLAPIEPRKDVAEATQFTLLQGLPKGEKMEFIIQKTTELGIARIVPFVAQRTIARPTAEKGRERAERWRKIAQEAARQSGRSQAPMIADICEYGAMLGSARQSVKLLLWEEERSARLKDQVAALKMPLEAAILVGPEGGLSAAEAQMARDSGFVSVNLGKRILRTETAGLATLAILQFLWGDLG